MGRQYTEVYLAEKVGVGVTMQLVVKNLSGERIIIKKISEEDITKDSREKTMAEG